MTGSGPRDGTSDERDREGTRRDALADRRDRAANRRDDAAERCDRAATERERVAEDFDRLHPTAAGAGDVGAWALARRNAAADRSRAAADRGSARADRVAGAEDRDSAERDREFVPCDALTGAYLRGPGMVALDREIVRAARTAQPLIVAFADVDGLKAVNDQHGHAAGDAALVAVAAALGSNLRDHDLVIRYGGDEFVCVVEGLGLTAAAQRLDLVRAALRSGPEPIRISAGLAEWRSGETAGDLLARADDDLYRRRGRPRAGHA